MIKRKISNLELSTLTYFISRAFLVGVTFNSLLSSMKQNSWMTPLFGIIPGIIYILAIINIMNYKPNLNMNEKLDKLFPKPISYFFIIIISTILLFACTLNFLNLSNFIQSQFLSRTPILIISFLFTLVSLYVINKGINTISRTSNILFYISIIFLFITILGLIPNIKIFNILPLFNLKIQNYLEGINTFYAFHICPIFILTIIPKNKFQKNKITKVIIFSYILANITIVLSFFITLTAFGYKLAMLYEYPLFHILKHISITGLAARIESILVMQLIFDFFICHVLILYFISTNIKHLTNTKNNNIWYIIISIIIIIGITFFSRYSIYLDEFLKLKIPLITTILASIIILIICIKIKMSN